MNTLDCIVGTIVCQQVCLLIGEISAFHSINVHHDACVKHTSHPPRSCLCLLSFNLLSMYMCRLINRGLYPLAVEICSYLKLPPEEGEVKVLRQWALRKVHVCIWWWTSLIPRSHHTHDERVWGHWCWFLVLQAQQSCDYLHRLYWSTCSHVMVRTTKKRLPCPQTLYSRAWWGLGTRLPQKRPRV